MLEKIGGRLVIATHNAGKLEEMRALLADFPFELTSSKELGLDEPEETGTTFIENARIKAHASVAASGLPCLADDSGIEIDALDRAPGVYTADWAETETGRDFRMAMEVSHEKLLETGAEQPWTCRFCSTLVLAFPDGTDFVFEGKAEGHFVWPMRGIEGHGYDPIFQPIGYDRTFAEMPANEKNAISHRGRSIKKFIAALKV